MHPPFAPATSHPVTLFCFRQDLRLIDNPGLHAAAQNGPVLAVYILDNEVEGAYKRGAASRSWLHRSLEQLDAQLGHKLNKYVGDTLTVLNDLMERYVVQTVYWNRCYEPHRIQQDKAIAQRLQELGIACRQFNGTLLWEPWEIYKANNQPYRIYTAFYRQGCLRAAKQPRRPLPQPHSLTLIQDPKSCALEELSLLPRIRWDKKLYAHWQVGEAGAQRALQLFLHKGMAGYKKGRNFPSQNQVSRLSPYLHLGQISPHQVWHSVLQLAPHQVAAEDRDHFLCEIAWREFAYYLLYHFPELPYKNFQTQYDMFPWCHHAQLLSAWQRGQTGYPLVDAGMRELWQTGYMHNRVRMVVASFLVKNLLIHWHHGRDWFWNCLVDADLANNSASWQWVAGTGADAAPYFRIFNPILQSKQFDPQGEYIRQFLPELRNLPTAYLHEPWKAPPMVLREAHVWLGNTYPYPIVDLNTSRKKALEAYQAVKAKP